MSKDKSKRGLERKRGKEGGLSTPPNNKRTSGCRGVNSLSLFSLTGKVRPFVRGGFSFLCKFQ